MSNGTAPVCPVSRPQPTQLTPTGLGVNSIPRAHNLISVITAINTMNHVVQQLTRGLPQINNIGTPPTAPPPLPGYTGLVWREANRNYTQQKVVNPDDDTQVVLIKTVSGIQWAADPIGSTLLYQG